MNWKERIKGWEKKYPICTQEYRDQKDFVNPYVFMEELSKHLDDDAIIIPDSGGTLIWCMQGLNLKKGQTLFTSFNHSPMGYSLPAGIGAWYANPDRQIVCIMGDGACNMNIQELATVAYNKIPLKMFVMDNKEYGIINQTLRIWLGGNEAGSSPESGLAFPDLSKIAQAYGHYIYKLRDNDSLSELNYIMNNPFAMFTTVNIKKGQEMLPKLTAGHSLEDLYPYLSKEEFEKNKL